MTAPNIICYKKVECGRQNDAPLQDVHNSSSQKLWICYRGLMLLNQLTLRSGEFTEISGWLQQWWKSGKEGREDQNLRDLKMLHYWWWRWKEPQAQKCPQPLKAANSQETDPPLEPPEGDAPAGALMLAQGHPFQTGDLHKSQIISLYRLKSLGLWLFTIVADKNNDTGTSDRRVNSSFL